MWRYISGEWFYAPDCANAFAQARARFPGATEWTIARTATVDPNASAGSPDNDYFAYLDSLDAP